MANTRDILRRRKSVANIGKITRTMEMIATARFKKAHDRASAARPYIERLDSLLADFVAGDQRIDHPLMRRQQKPGRVVMLVLTSTRGLCGGYNVALFRTAAEELEHLKENDTEFDLHVSGRKGIQHFAFIKQPAQATYTNFDEKTSYAEVTTLARELIDLYCREQITAVKVVYARLVSAVIQRADVIELLPLAEPAAPAGPGGDPSSRRISELDEYVYSPDADAIMAQLIPEIAAARLYHCMVEAAVSEHAARMTAMKTATENGEQMMHALTRRYNRVRQSQITGALLDIVGGTEAMNQ